METREKIVSTALKLFLQKGFYHVSLAMIAAEVGISKPAIYHHFQNKEALVEGVLDFFTYRMTAWNRDYLADLSSGRDYINKIFQAIPIYKNVEKILLEEDTEEYPYTYNNLLQILSKYKPEFRERIARDARNFREVLTRNIIASQAEGTIKSDIDPSSLAILIHTVLEGSAFITELDGSLDVDILAADLLNITWKLIEKK
ncbi:MAG: TetR/AcrR family transcriptional regulator [Candidatus Cloacimonetes bacterium]|nr:TetR/AcrR family transcriptional regulator [Candidatus Cloacimonadota bacterium]